MSPASASPGDELEAAKTTAPKPTDREAAFAEERAANRTDAANRAVMEEQRDWEQADTDGID